MIQATWGGFLTIALLAVSFFLAGILWEHETAERREEKNNARRRAHRINNRKETRQS
jgi:hypothetical protein